MAARKKPAAKSAANKVSTMPSATRASAKGPSAKGPSAKKSSPRKAPPRPRSKAALGAHAATILARLLERYPDAHCALDFRNPYELLCATILSAQCTDKRVNMVTPALFARYPDAAALADAAPGELEEIIRSTGFYRSKAKSLIGMAQGLVQRHGGEVPDEMDALVVLPGVGRKTANVVLGDAFDRREGIVVDTHVTRLGNRLGLTRESDAVKIELALLPLFPRQHWTKVSHLLIEHGRQVCDAKKPRCGDCVLADLCPSSLV